MKNCSTCKHWMRLKPGFAGICILQMRVRKWEDGVAVTNARDSCTEHKSTRLVDSMPKFAEVMFGREDLGEPS